MTPNSFAQQSSRLIMITLVAMTSLASQSAFAGGLFFGGVTARQIGQDVELEADVKGASGIEHVAYAFTPETPMLRRFFSPHAVRQEFIRIAELRRGDAEAAKQLLNLRAKYPELNAWMTQHPESLRNAMELKEHAIANEKYIGFMKKLQKDGGGADVESPLNPNHETLAAFKGSLEEAYPGLAAVYEKYPDLKQLLLKNPNVFKPRLSMLEQAQLLVYKFPIESLSFFIAQGAIYEVQLQTDASSNPLAMENHVESQTDPVTIFSFAALMATNGIAVEPMMHAWGHKSFARFLPYLGLTLGMTASEITSDIVTNFKNGAACQADLRKNHSVGKSCESLFSEIGETSIAEKFNNFMPGILSMTASMFASGMIETGVKWTAGTVAAGVVKTGATAAAARAMEKVAFGRFVKVAFLWGSDPALDVAMFGLSIAQNYMFQSLTAAVSDTVNTGYRNIIDTVNFESHDRYLSHAIHTPEDFSQQDKGRLLAEIMDFGHDMRIWREANLAPVMGADSLWQMKLRDLSTNYDFAKSFYRDFIDKLGYERGTAQSDETISVDFANPMIGVYPDDIVNQFPKVLDLYGDHARDVVRYQKRHVHKVGDWLAARLSKMDKKDIANMTPEAAGVYRLEWQIARDFQSENVSKIAEKLEWIFVGAHVGPAHAKIPTEGYWIASFQSEFAQILSKLGYNRDVFTYHVAGSWHPGETFAYAWNTELNERLHGHDLSRATIPGLPMQPPKNALADFYIASMIAGPNPYAKNTLTKDSLGWKTQFIPPRIVPAVPTGYSVPASLSPSGLPSAQDPRFSLVFDVPVMYGKAKFDNMFDVLRHEHIFQGQENADGTIVKGGYTRGDVKTFDKFWEEQVDPQFRDAWVDYEEKYQVIIRRLVDLMYTPLKTDDAHLEFNYKPYKWVEKLLHMGDIHLDMGRVNDGPVGNGQITAMNQEFQTYLLLLGRVISPNHPAEQIRKLPGYDVPNPLPGKLADDVSGGLLYQFRNLSTVSWEMDWQKKLMQSYQSIETIAGHIKIADAPLAKDKSKHVFVPVLPVDADQFDVRYNALDAQLTNLKKVFDSGLRNPQDRQLAEACIEQMRAVATQMRALISTANAISYVATKNGTAMPTTCNDQIGKPLGSLSSDEKAALADCESHEVDVAGMKSATNHDNSDAALRDLQF